MNTIVCAILVEMFMSHMPWYLVIIYILAGLACGTCVKHKLLFKFSKIQNETSSPSCEDVQDKSYVLLDLETIYMGQQRGFQYLSGP